MFLSPQHKTEFGWPFLQALAAQKLAVYNDTDDVDALVEALASVIGNERDWYIQSDGTWIFAYRFIEKLQPSRLSAQIDMFRRVIDGTVAAHQSRTHRV